MTDREWSEWITYHSTLFWMLSDQDAILFREWRPALAEYSLGELREASLHMASVASKSSTFRTAHLGLLRERIHARRYEFHRAEREEFERAAESLQCRHCGGSGLVTVPHHACIVDGLWRHPWYSQAVCCSCNRGSHRFNRINAILNERDKRTLIMDLAQYEALHPDWPSLVEQRKAIFLAEHRARWHAEQADRKAPIRPEQMKEQLMKITQTIGKGAAAS